MDSLCSIIVAAQSLDETAMLALVEKFKPLLLKYAHRLRSEDAYDDLLADFMELIREFQLSKMNSTSDGSLVNYIKRSVIHSFIKYSRKHRGSSAYNELSLSDLDEAETSEYIETLSTLDTYFSEELPFSQILTPDEYQLLQMLFVHNLTVGEVALKTHVTRQAVNQMKNRAFTKIKNSIEKEI